jgi:hypothetical protein
VRRFSRSSTARGGPWGLVAIASAIRVVLIVAFRANVAFIIVVAAVASLAVWFYVLLRTQHTTVSAHPADHPHPQSRPGDVVQDRVRRGDDADRFSARKCLVQELLARKPSIETRGRSKDF